MAVYWQGRVLAGYWQVPNPQIPYHQESLRWVEVLPEWQGSTTQQWQQCAEVEDTAVAVALSPRRSH